MMFYVKALLCDYGMSFESWAERWCCCILSFAVPGWETGGAGGQRKMLTPCRLLLCQLAINISYHVVSGGELITHTPPLPAPMHSLWNYSMPQLSNPVHILSLLKVHHRWSCLAYSILLSYFVIALLIALVNKDLLNACLLWLTASLCLGGSDIFAKVRENSPTGEFIANLSIIGDPGANSIRLCLTGDNADWFFLEGRTIRLNSSFSRNLDREVSLLSLLVFKMKFHQTSPC